MLTVTISGNTRKEFVTTLAEVVSRFSDDLSALAYGTEVELELPPSAKTKKVAKPKAEELEVKDNVKTGTELTNGAAEITLDDLRVTFQNYAKEKAGNREKAMKALEKFGAKKLTELKPEQYAGVLTALGL